MMSQMVLVIYQLMVFQLTLIYTDLSTVLTLDHNILQHQESYSHSLK